MAALNASSPVVRATDAPIHVYRRRHLVLISAHAYKEIDDYVRLAGIVRSACYG
jgi:hypothetical protein